MLAPMIHHEDDALTKLQTNIKISPHLGLNFVERHPDAIVFEGVAENRRGFGRLEICTSSINANLWDVKLSFTNETGYGIQRNRTLTYEGKRTNELDYRLCCEISDTIYNPEISPDVATARYLMLRAIFENGRHDRQSLMSKMAWFAYPRHRRMIIYFNNVIKTAVIVVQANTENYQITYSVVQTTNENTDLFLVRDEMVGGEDIRFPTQVFGILYDLRQDMIDEPVLEPFVEPPEPA